VLEERLAASLEDRARRDLLLAPRILRDRDVATADAMMMKAKDFAHAAGLADAIRRNDRAALLRVIEAARPLIGDGVPIIIGPSGEVLAGPRPSTRLIDSTRRGGMPVELESDDGEFRKVALAPVVAGEIWLGAAGYAMSFGNQAVGELAGLTQSAVTIVSSTGRVGASTLASEDAAAVVAALGGDRAAGRSRELDVGGRRILTVVTPLSNAGHIVFTRALADELAVLRELRRLALASGAAGLVLALALGAWLARRVSNPVSQLAEAATAMGAGEFRAPLPSSRVDEVSRVASAFDEMRRALAQRLRDLHDANAALHDRNARLSALQADLMQRERLAATGRLVAQLAHEIRNPIANVRNCLELIRRRVDADPEAREFADLAIDELLRMHELAEQMLDLHRPQDPHATCRPVGVAREVARLTTAGNASDRLTVHVDGEESIAAAIPPDALKQVLLNLVLNAREATASRAQPGVVRLHVTSTSPNVIIEVDDNGPGVSHELRERIFDPFFTTKGAVHGVGLGLFVAEGLVRSAGGRIAVGTSRLGGAAFRIELPLARPTVDEVTADRVRGIETTSGADRPHDMSPSDDRPRRIPDEPDASTA
jgi:signal transduction histidine kinase